MLSPFCKCCLRCSNHLPGTPFTVCSHTESHPTRSRNDNAAHSRSSEANSQRDMAYARQEQNRTAGQDSAAALDFASASRTASLAAALAGVSASPRSSHWMASPPALRRKTPCVRHWQSREPQRCPDLLSCSLFLSCVCRVSLASGCSPQKIYYGQCD